MGALAEARCQTTSCYNIENTGLLHSSSKFTPKTKKQRACAVSIMGKSRRSDEVGPAEGRRVRKPGDAAATGKYLCRAR